MIVVSPKLLMIGKAERIRAENPNYLCEEFRSLNNKFGNAGKK
jgi:hypothetical protein